METGGHPPSVNQERITMNVSSIRVIGLFCIASAIAIYTTGCGAKQDAQTPPTSDSEIAVETPSAVDSPASQTQPQAAARAPETVLVKVDETSITQADLEKEMDKMRMLMKNSGLAPENIELLVPTMEPQIIEGLVSKTLLDNECVKQNIVVSDDDLKSEIEMIKSDLPEGATLEEMMERSGMTQAAFESEVAGRIKLKKLLNIPDPTDEQVKAYYEENKEYFEVPETVRARHILIKVEETDSDETKADKKAKAEAIRKELVDGADFAKLAEERSDCPSSRQGGSLGNVRRGQMVAPFEEATFNLKTGEISEVVETQFGYHIIEAIEHKDAKALKFDEVAPRIKSVLKSEEFQKKAGEIVESLKEKAAITYSEEIKRDEM